VSQSAGLYWLGRPISYGWLDTPEHREELWVNLFHNAAPRYLSRNFQAQFWRAIADWMCLWEASPSAFAEVDWFGDRDVG
jgi:hypothetical protein